MRILVVEDDVNLNRQLVEALQEAGYVVDKAFDGEKVISSAIHEPYDAVILDIVCRKWTASPCSRNGAPQAG